MIERRLDVEDGVGLTAGLPHRISERLRVHAASGGRRACRNQLVVRHLQRACDVDRHSPVLHPEDEVATAALAEVVGNRLGKRRSPRHVVCSVDHDRGAAVHDLETAGDDDRAEGLLDDIIGQRRIEEFLDGRERQRGILGLVGSMQRQEHLVVEAPWRAYAEQSAADSEAIVGEVECLTANDGLCGPLVEEDRVQ
ncbi:MAG: hypothetical protein VX194_10255 [Actinomycetota bacterium]|nr:hypothetical protein [Actinomycetota bacterium]